MNDTSRTHGISEYYRAAILLAYLLEIVNLIVADIAATAALEAMHRHGLA